MDRKPDSKSVIRTPSVDAVVRHDKIGGMLRALTPTLSQSMGTVYIDFGGDASRANDFFDLLMEMVEAE